MTRSTWRAALSRLRGPVSRVIEQWEVGHGER